MQDKINGLHSGTKFYERFNGNLDRTELHEHPKTGELIAVRTVTVANGNDGDVDFESEVLWIADKQACQFMKEMMVEIEHIKDLIRKI